MEREVGHVMERDTVERNCRAGYACRDSIMFVPVFHFLSNLTLLMKPSRGKWRDVSPPNAFCDTACAAKRSDASFSIFLLNAFKAYLPLGDHFNSKH